MCVRLKGQRLNEYAIVQFHECVSVTIFLDLVLSDAVD